MSPALNNQKKYAQSADFHGFPRLFLESPPVRAHTIKVNLPIYKSESLKYLY
jgi:hypothetical protein